MTKIFYKYRAGMIGLSKDHIIHFAPDAEPTFRVVTDSTPVTVTINTGSNDIEAITEYDLDDEYIELFKNYSSLQESKQRKAIKEIAKISRPCAESVRKVVWNLKYYFNWRMLKESLSAKTDMWSTDGNTWHRAPYEITIGGVRAILQFTIQKDEIGLLEDCVIENKTLHALRHLHKAQNEHNPRHKWIDATIAAEHAIKECLVRLRPELEPLILKIPSPPIHILYGDVLNSIVNNETTKVDENRKILLKEIEKGAIKRNALIHTPVHSSPSKREVERYVLAIELAIFHLLTILHPTDPVIRFHHKIASDAYGALQMNKDKGEVKPKISKGDG